MKRQMFSLLSAALILALFGISTGAVASQSATATVTATPCPTVTASTSTQSPSAASPTTEPTTAPTAAATPDFSAVDTFAKFAAQLAQSPHQTVKSADGKLTLLIPPGALPADTPLSKLKFTTLNPATAPTIGCTRPLLAYQLNPDGLHFTTPAVAILTIDPPKDGSQPQLFSVSGQTVEPLTPIIYSTDAKSKKLIITAAIAHFSDLEAATLSGATISFSGLQSHVPGDSFTVSVTATGPTVHAPGVLGGTGSVEPFLTASGSWTVLGPIDTTSAIGADAFNKSTFQDSGSFSCNDVGIGTITYTLTYGYDSQVVGPPQPTLAETSQSFSVFCVYLVSELKATFTRPVTSYLVTASDPDGDPLSYTWSNDNNENGGHPCGGWSFNQYTATWDHPDSGIPGACILEDVHPGTITVVVSDGHGASETVAYKAGSAPGDCTFGVQTGIGGPCAIQKP